MILFRDEKDEQNVSNIIKKKFFNVSPETNVVLFTSNQR